MASFCKPSVLLVHFPALTDAAMKERFQMLDQEHPIANGDRIEGIMQHGRLCFLESL